jgi:glycine dehydrogenase subunit 1
MSLIGKNGLTQMAELCYQKTQYLKSEIKKLPNITIINKAPTFNEFILESSICSQDLLDSLKSHGFYGGINLANLYEDRQNQILVSVTEKRTKEEMDSLVNAIRSIL